MTAVEHFRFLAEFVKGVEYAGGTTPHVAMTVESMRRIDDPLEKLWFAGCYALTYNWATAERIWLEWRPEDNFDNFLEWADEHWVGLPLRKERKAVFRKPFFAECAQSYIGFARRVVDERWPETWDEAFSWYTYNCKYMGRYIAIRWLEVLRRAYPSAEPAGWVMPDISADGGQHPRKALALIYPEDAEALLGGNSRREVAIANEAADLCIAELATTYGINTDYYTMQSLLCEYKQSALGRRQYPGKSIDSEMAYHDKVAAHWGQSPTFFEVRRACFPEWSLGELQGWHGVRDPLMSVQAVHGYTWSDAVYDWRQTTDVAHPAKRLGGWRSIL